MPSFDVPDDIDLDIRRVELEIAQLELDHRAAKRHVDYFYSGMLVGYFRQSPEVNNTWSSRMSGDHDRDSRVRRYDARNNAYNDYPPNYQPIPRSRRRDLMREQQFRTQEPHYNYNYDYDYDYDYVPRHSRTSNGFNVVFREPAETRRSRSRTSKPKTRIDERGRMVRLPDEIEELSDFEKPHQKVIRPKMKLLKASEED